jgi:Na+/H+-dicarboxylate symporter
MTDRSSQKLATRILVALAIGAVLGSLALWIGQGSPNFLAACVKFSDAVLDPIGQVFLRLLFFVVIPLVFASLTLGIVQLGSLSRLGPLAGRTALFFFANMAIGVALGLLVMNAVKPGNRLSDAQYGTSAEKTVASQKKVEEQLSLKSVVEMFMPRNLPGTVTGFSRDAIGEVLPLILFAILLGAAGVQLQESKRQGLEKALETVTELMTRIVHFALLLAPIAVPAMIFSVIVKVGLDILLALMLFVVCCLGVMAVHLFGTMSVWLALLAKENPAKFFWKIRAVLITAFSTSSSNATLPTSLQVCREELKLSPSTSGFVLPLGATMNMSGTALFEGCVVLFIAQIYGVDLSIQRQLTLLFLTVLSAVAVSGIPGGSLPLIAGLLVTFGIPAEGIAIILGVDRILDMSRTVVNVGADVVTATIVDRRMGVQEVPTG